MKQEEKDYNENQLICTPILDTQYWGYISLLQRHFLRFYKTQRVPKSGKKHSCPT